MRASTTPQTHLLSRLGFVSQGEGFVWGNHPLDIQALYGEAPQILQVDGAWVFQRPFMNPDLPGFQTPEEAALQAASVGRLGSSSEALTEKQFRVLMHLAVAYKLPWANLLPWFSHLGVGWLRIACRAEGIPDAEMHLPQVRGFDLEATLRIKDIRFTVNVRGEVLISFIHPCAPYRYRHQFMEALDRCRDLPFVNDLLLAAIPPPVDRGEEVLATIRVVLGDAEFSCLFPILTAEQIGALREGLLAVTGSLELVNRFGEWVEETMPKYTPDDDLWVWENKLRWRGYVLCTLSPFRIEPNLPKIAVSEEQLILWFAASHPDRHNFDQQGAAEAILRAMWGSSESEMGPSLDADPGT